MRRNARALLHGGLNDCGAGRLVGCLRNNFTSKTELTTQIMACCPGGRCCAQALCQFARRAACSLECIAAVDGEDVEELLDQAGSSRIAATHTAVRMP
ncbi:hypothetical protein KL86DES1_10549 [uncultured Desulfovibrio sp.]|uniref:Uncharacterized protein n=1 Tax=uncultured Desulfovibrio sp. TaxID=167968 RepID=A0A212KZF6_9BACT|nr:hypothetical protein KL86DES1_10549 [uncultured Desulfovibrio sp.]VZH32424.1 conserved protein of unknown function [Desulfovibrio sp. 86]